MSRLDETYLPDRPLNQISQSWSHPDLRCILPLLSTGSRASCAAAPVMRGIGTTATSATARSAILPVLLCLLLLTLPTLHLFLCGKGIRCPFPIPMRRRSRLFSRQIRPVGADRGWKRHCHRKLVAELRSHIFSSTWSRSAVTERDSPGTWHR